MSRKATSGLCFAIAARASRPFEHWATSSKSGADWSRISMPLLERASSSTMIVEIFTRVLPQTGQTAILTVRSSRAPALEAAPCPRAIRGGCSAPRTYDAHHRAQPAARECFVDPLHVARLRVLPRAFRVHRQLRSARALLPECDLLSE